MFGNADFNSSAISGKHAQVQSSDLSDIEDDDEGIFAQPAPAVLTSDEEVQRRALELVARKQRINSSDQPAIEPIAWLKHAFHSIRSKFNVYVLFKLSYEGFY